MNLPLKCHDLIVEVACNPITELYAEGKCENCPETDLESLADCDSIIYIYIIEGSEVEIIIRRSS